jgi:DNA-binding HxlR family transcriptional regulator
MARTRASADHADELRSRCPVACSLDVLGDRWTLLVIRDLFAGKSRFGEFMTSPERIPTNILAERLKRLERAGLIATTPYSEHPLRVDYRLTERGQALAPVVNAIAVWGLAQFPGTRRRSVRTGDSS